MSDSNDLEYPYKSGGGKRYKKIIYDGSNEKYRGDIARLYESGHIATWEDGRIIEPAGHTLMTRDKAIELNKRRRELAAARARDFVVSELAAASGLDNLTFESAWGLLIGKLAASGLDSNQPLHARVKAVESVGKASGVIGARGEKLEDRGGESDKMLQLLQALRPYLAAALGRDNTENHGSSGGGPVIDL